jgi:hypothetical protein
MNSDATVVFLDISRHNCSATSGQNLRKQCDIRGPFSWRKISSQTASGKSLHVVRVTAIVGSRVLGAAAPSAAKAARKCSVLTMTLRKSLFRSL